MARQGFTVADVKRLLRWLVPTTVVAVVAVAAYVLLADPPTENRRTAAYEACQEFVTDRLKAPATAQFPERLDVVVEERPNDRFVVDGYVDSENSFSALIRSSFTCETVYGDGRFHLSRVEISED